MFDNCLKYSVFVSLFLLTCNVASAQVDNDRLSAADSLCMVALDHTYHGRFNESNAIFDNILSSCKLSKEGKATMYGLLAQNEWLSGDYPGYYKYQKKRLKREELKKLEMQKDLSMQPVETLIRPDEDIRIGYKIDSLYYEGEFKGCEMRIPTTIGGKEELMILDNGCAFFSLASESFAVEHGIKPIGVKGKAVGNVDKVSMWIGVADSLSIGSMVFRNILFTVIPDEYLQNPVSKIDAALGANIFRLAGEIRFDNENRTITFPYKQTDATESNVTINASGMHLMDVAIGNDVLRFQLDLGASSTQLTYNYFQRYHDAIVSEYSSDTAMYGGVGGVATEQVYRIDHLVVKACGGQFTKESIKISTEKKANESEVYGILGLDYLLSFTHATLNLQKMYLEVE